MTVEVEVTLNLKRGVTDPEGENTKKALILLGFNNVHSVESMKAFRIAIDADEEERDAVKYEVEEMCKKLLANPVIHDYKISVVK